MGVEIDFFIMIVFLLLQKEQTILQFQDLLGQTDIILRANDQTDKSSSSAGMALLPAPLQSRSLQRQKIEELAEKQSFIAREVL